jgi:regulator of sigma E protease
MIRISIAMLISGAAGMEDISGPVGIVDAMNTISQQSPTTAAALGNIVFFMAFIGINVAIVNLLPIPAMDGGRILFIFLTWVIETITRRRLNPKYEGYINTGAFVLLIGLMVIILYNDIIRIVQGG